MQMRLLLGETPFSSSPLLFWMSWYFSTEIALYPHTGGVGDHGHGVGNDDLLLRRRLGLALPDFLHRLSGRWRRNILPAFGSVHLQALLAVIVSEIHLAWVDRIPDLVHPFEHLHTIFVTKTKGCLICL